MKHTATKIVLTALLCMGSIVLFAQTGDSLQKNSAGNIFFARIRPNATSPLKDGAKFLQGFLRARPGHEFRLAQEQTDEMGITHQRYAQYYQGVKIEQAEYLVHGKGLISTINGDFADISLPSVAPAVKAGEGLKAALDIVHAKKYGWEDPASEDRYKKLHNNPAATLYPTPELVIYHDDSMTHAYRLVYKIHIYAVQPLVDNNIFVDAQSGKIVARENLVRREAFDNAGGNAATLYSGTQAVTMDSYNTPLLFRLRETRTSGAFTAQIQTLNMQGGSVYGNAIDFSNPTTTWAADAGLDVHWGTEKVFDFWAGMGRNSYNAAGGTLLGYVHTNIIPMGFSNNDNAFWDPTMQAMTYADGTTAFHSVVSLDVVAHEIGHGVCQFTAGLGNSGEAAALNEGLSDIWGACVEQSANVAGKQTWLIGEDIMANGAACLRSMSNPKTQSWTGGSATGGFPDTYHGQFWDNGNEPHTNSTVLSHWFFLLSQGGTGTNDLHNNFNVSGIGIGNAAQIAYRMERLYMSSGSTYASTRTAAIEAARDLFGAGSCQEVAVTNAWYAVGVGASYVLQPAIVINGPAVVCNGANATYTLSSVPAKAIITWTSTNPSTSLQVAADGLSAVLTNNAASSSTSIVVTWGGCPGQRTTVKSVGLGAPGPVGIVTYYNANYCDYNDFAILASNGASNYPYSMQLQVAATGATALSWSNPYPGGSSHPVYWEDMGGGTVMVSTKFSSGGYLTLACRASNSCGNTTGYYSFQPLICNVSRAMTPGGNNPAVNTQALSLAVFPNPATDVLTITLPDAIAGNHALIRITDMYGRQVKRIENAAGTTTTPVSQLAAGIYFVEIYSGSKIMATKKIVKH